MSERVADRPTALLPGDRHKHLNLLPNKKKVQKAVLRRARARVFQIRVAEAS